MLTWHCICLHTLNSNLVKALRQQLQPLFFGVWCNKLCTSAFVFQFSLDHLKLCQVGWGPSVDWTAIYRFLKDVWLVLALAGPLEDVHRVVPKLLLHCLGCVRRVIVILEGELSAQSEVLSALNQVFIKDISVLSCIQLSVFSDHFPSPCRWKTPPTAWCCRHHASRLGWYYSGDKRCLLSLRHE